MIAATLVQRQLDTYNSKDIEGFLACYHEDAVVSEYGGRVLYRGKPEIRAAYTRLFSEQPRRYATLVSRLCFAATVIDHERIDGTPDGRTLEAVAIYLVRRELIADVQFIHAGPN